MPVVELPLDIDPGGTPGGTPVDTSLALGNTVEPWVVQWVEDPSLGSERQSYFKTKIDDIKET